MSWNYRQNMNFTPRNRLQNFDQSGQNFGHLNQLQPQSYAQPVSWNGSNYGHSYTRAGNDSCLGQNFLNSNVQPAFVQHRRIPSLLSIPTWQHPHSGYNDPIYQRNDLQHRSSNQRQNLGTEYSRCNYGNITDSSRGKKKINRQEAKMAPMQNVASTALKKEVKVDLQQTLDTGSANKSNFVDTPKKKVSEEKKEVGPVDQRPLDQKQADQRSVDQRPLNQKPLTDTKSRALSQASTRSTKTNDIKTSNEGLNTSKNSYTNNQHEAEKRSQSISQDSRVVASNSCHTAEVSIKSPKQSSFLIPKQNDAHSKSSSLSSTRLVSSAQCMASKQAKSSVESSSGNQQTFDVQEDLGLATRLNISLSGNLPHKVSQKSPLLDSASPIKGVTNTKQKPQLGCDNFGFAATLNTSQSNLHGAKDSQTLSTPVLPKTVNASESLTDSIIDNKHKCEPNEENLKHGAKINLLSTGDVPSEKSGDKLNSEGKEGNKSTPSFTKAHQTYKEYREAKQKEEEERKNKEYREAKQKEEEERKKMEARRNAQLQDRRHRHHSYSSHSKQHREEFKRRSMSTEQASKALKPGPFQSSTEKSQHIFQSSSYFGQGDPSATEINTSQIKQKLPFRSENSSFSPYKKEPAKIKVEDEGKSEKSSRTVEQDGIVTSEKESQKDVSSVSEMECSKDDDLPGIVVQRRSSSKLVEKTSTKSRLSSRDSSRSSSQDTVLYRWESQGSLSHGGSQDVSKNTSTNDLSSENDELLKEDGFRAISGRDDDDIHRYGSDLEVDMSYSDDDDDDLEAPDFLVDLENAWRKPVPRTPPPKTHGSPAPSDSPVPMRQMSNPSKPPLSKFSLDALLSEETDKTKEQLEMEEMHAKLERDVRTGGFAKNTLDKDIEHPVQGELLPDQRAQIQKLEVLDSVLKTTHPGEKLFVTERHQHLFNSSLKPQECGFKPGKSYIDEHLTSLQPANYNDLFMSHLLMECLQSVSDQRAILSWIYLYMSTEESSLAVDGCFDVLEEYYYCEKHFNDRDTPSWAPSIADVLSALCNFGCDANFLLPSQLLSPSVLSSMHQQQNLPAVRNGTRGFQIENLRLMLVVLTYGLQSRAKYKSEELTALLVMLCRSALDERLSSELLTLELQCCIWAIVQKYSETDWDSQRVTLCAILSAVTSHHHNAVYLCGLLPLSPRGMYLQRRISLMFLLKIFNIETTDVENVKLKNLYQFLPLMKELVEEDMYKLSSCLNLLDRCIGNDTVKISEKDDLNYIMDQVKKMSGEIRENVRVLDKSRLKDLMVRLTSKWTMLLLSCGSSQKTLFECTNGNIQKFKIETVQASQSDNESEQSDQSEAEMEDPLGAIEAQQ